MRNTFTLTDQSLLRSPNRISRHHGHILAKFSFIWPALYSSKIRCNFRQP